MGTWVADFNEKIARYCADKPRYSELRPLKFGQVASYYPHSVQ